MTRWSADSLGSDRRRKSRRHRFPAGLEDRVQGFTTTDSPESPLRVSVGQGDLTSITQQARWLPALSAGGSARATKNEGGGSQRRLTPATQRRRRRGPPA